MTEPDSAGVRLRDVRLADADLLDAWNADDAARTSSTISGSRPSCAPRDVLKAGPLRNEHNGVFIVERAADAQPIGTIGWHRVRYGPNPESDAWNIGIELRPEARGYGFGTDAQRQLTDWLFANTNLNRVEAQTDVENVAEQRSLEKAGFVREGIARGAQFRTGSFHDLVTYSRVRADP